MNLITVKEKDIKRLLNLPSDTEIKLSATTSKKALKKPRKTETNETTIPSRYANGVSKTTLCKIKLGGNYQEIINDIKTATKQNPDFQSKGTYVEPMDENHVVWIHKDDVNLDSLEDARIYIRTYRRKKLHNVASLYEDESLHDEQYVNIYYDSNGEEITQEEYNEAMRKYCSGWTDPAKKVANAQERQGLERPVHVNNWGLDNIKYVEVDGEAIITRLDEAQAKELMSRLK